MTYNDYSAGDFGSIDIGSEATIAGDLVDETKGYAKGPERHLIGALLFDGIQNFMNYSTATTAMGRARYREAYNWIMSRETEYVFSFVESCEALGIEPRSLRLGLLNTLNAETFQWRKARKKY